MGRRFVYLSMSLLTAFLFSAPGEAHGEMDMWEAAEAGQLKVVKKFVKKAKSHINDLNGEGYTPLMLAAREGRAEVVKYLIKKGADVDAVAGNMWGYTALMKAAWKNRSEAARLLIKAGADLELRNSEGETALQVALGSGSSEAVALLKEAALKRKKK